MPSEKEIEEALRIFNGKPPFGCTDDESRFYRLGKIISGAYLSMKSERDDYKYLYEHECIATSRLESDRDKLKAIVEAVKNAHREYADDGRVWLECRDIDNALAMREKN